MAYGQWSYRRVGLVTGIAVICLITTIYIGLMNKSRVNLSQVQWSVEDFGHHDYQQAGVQSSSPKNATPEGSKSDELCSIETRSWKLREACKSLPGPERHGNPWFLLVDKTHKVLFCFLQKVGSSTMKSFFVSMKPKFNHNRHSWHVMSKMGYKSFGSFPNTERQRLLNEYTKVVVVRHPFDRLRSVYYDKFVYNKHIGSASYVQAIKQYRENKTDMSTTMTFREFIKYILDRRWPDQHWAPYFETSLPCQMNYDYILRLETFERDLDIFIEEVLKMPDDNLYRGVDNQGEYDLRPMESRVSLDRYIPEFASVSAGDLARLQVMYGKDFEVFGYTWGSNTTGHCSIHVGKDSCC